MALAPWNVLAGGKIRTDAEEEKRIQSGENGRDLGTLTGGVPGWLRNDDQKKMAHALEKVAKEVRVDSITAVAIAYVMQKAPYVFPLIGGRKVEHLMDNIKALEVSLSTEQISFLESILPFDPGFPNNVIGDGTRQYLIGMAAHHSQLPIREPIRPNK